MLTTYKLSKPIFYILTATWGIIMSLAGVIVAIALRLIGYKPTPNQYGWCFKIGKNWGGCSLGPIYLVDQDVSQHTLDHEFGHSIQNCYFGPFMLIISIWSGCRYQYRRLLKKQGKKLPPYDSIWFEGQATKIGEFYRTH